MKMHIWEYNGKYYMKINAVTIKEVHVENGFKQDVPYILDLTFSKYDFQKNGEQITGYSISEINKIYWILIYRYGIVTIKFKSIFFLKSY